MCWQTSYPSLSGMITSVMTTSGALCSICCSALKASGYVTTSIFSRRKAILITSRMVALSSMKTTVGVVLTLELPSRCAGAFVHFPQCFQQELGRRPQDGSCGGDRPWHELVHTSVDTVGSLDDVHNGIIANQVTGFGMRDITRIKKDDAIQLT